MTTAVVEVALEARNKVARAIARHDTDRTDRRRVASCSSPTRKIVSLLQLKEDRAR